jgi:nitrate/nitrite-specific signal transduction histidine kinase
VPPRIEQNWRVSLLEESAVIARELHDSLAYMKIQVSRPSKPAEQAGKTAGSRTGAA